MVAHRSYADQRTEQCACLSVSLSLLAELRDRDYGVFPQPLYHHYWFYLKGLQAAQYQNFKERQFYLFYTKQLQAGT